MGGLLAALRFGNAVLFMYNKKQSTSYGQAAM